MTYHYDTNHIITTTLKNRTGPCILNGITNIHGKLIKWGLTPKLQNIENEVSEVLHQYVEETDMQLQRVPPHTHQINSTKQAVRKF